MRLKSPEFENNQFIPEEFTCDGKDSNPPLIIEDIPKKTTSLALTVDDIDTPMIIWAHWLVFNIPVTSKIKANSVPGIQGVNTSSKITYHGPCPPFGIHRYVFKIYALDKLLSLKEGATKKQLMKAIKGHILDKAELIGLYKRVK